MYSPNRTTGQWREHGRESIRQGHKVSAFGNQAEGVQLADVLDQWWTADEPRLWKNYGLTWNMALEAGGFVMGDKVEIHLEIEAVKAQQTVAAG